MPLTGAVASLPGAILQKTNPGLFEVLQNGVIQGKLDFKTAIDSCEDMQEIILESDSPGAGLEAIAKSTSWNKKKKESDGDIISAKSEVEEENGNEGIPWVGNTKRGGIGQAPINSVYDATFVGYNLLMNRNVTFKSAISSTHGRGKPLWEYWKSPDSAAIWTREVLGEVSWRTCTGCKQLDSKPGKGLTYYYDEELNTIEDVLTRLVNGELSINQENMDAISAPPSLMIQEEIITAIKYESKVSKNIFISRIASEIALARTFEKGILAKRLLVTGKKEPNIINVQQAQESIQEAIVSMNDELSSIVEEMDLRKKVSGNALSMLLQRRDEIVNANATKGIPRAGDSNEDFAEL